MDPTNNPIPTPAPTPVSNPTPNPVAGDVSGTEPSLGGAVVNTPVMPGGASSVSPVPPSMPPVSPVAPVPPVPPVPPTPVNPVVTPSGGGLQAEGTQANPVAGIAYQPDDNGVRVAATDPIMMPEPAAEPDPVEEELKVPMKAAEPVPGSIGSAISVPKDGESTSVASTDNPFENKPDSEVTPSVSFNDPATTASGSSMMGNTSAKPAKAQNKTVLIILAVVAALVAAVLVVVLVMQLIGGGELFGSSDTSDSTISNTGNSSSVDVPNTDGGKNENSSVNVVEYSSIAVRIKVLKCEKFVKADQLGSYGSIAAAGMVKISADFDNNDVLMGLSKSVELYDTETPVVGDAPLDSVVVGEAELSELDGELALNFDLPVNENGKILTTLNNVQTNYEALDYSCEVL